MVWKTTDLLAALKRAGFKEHGSHGSHLKLKHDDGRIVIVPTSKSDMPTGTLRSICRQAGLTPAELRELS